VPAISLSTLRCTPVLSARGLPRRILPAPLGRTAVTSAAVAAAELRQRQAASLRHVTWPSEEIGTGLATLSLRNMTIGEVDEPAIPELAQVADKRLEGAAGRLRDCARPEGAFPALNPLQYFGVALVHGLLELRVAQPIELKQRS
jgi:hypothetical protein